jgi:hypothetical protein
MKSFVLVGESANLRMRVTRFGGRRHLKKLPNQCGWATALYTDAFYPNNTHLEYILYTLGGIYRIGFRVSMHAGDVYRYLLP